MVNQNSGKVHVKAVWLPQTVICPEEFLSDADSGFPEPVPISRCNVHFWKHKQRRFLGHQSVKHYLKSLAAKLALPLHLIETEGLRFNLLEIFFLTVRRLGRTISIFTASSTWMDSVSLLMQVVWPSSSEKLLPVKVDDSVHTGTDTALAQ